MKCKYFTNEESKFWNDNNIVKYFASKEADPNIVKRLARIKNTKDKKALDLGCGGGRHSELLASLGFDTYACDLANEMIKTTKKRVVKCVDNLTIKKGGINNIPFNEKFDVIIATGVLHQAKSFEEYEKAIKEIDRVSKKGTLVCMNVFTNKTMDKTYQVINQKHTVVITNEGLWMTLLSKNDIYALFLKYGFNLEKEISEDIKMENTGPRVVLRANFIKTR